MRRAIVLVVALATTTVALAFSTTDVRSDWKMPTSGQSEQVPAACIQFDPVIDHAIVSCAIANEARCASLSEFLNNDPEGRFHD